MTKICNLDDIRDGESTGLSATINGFIRTLIVVRAGNNAFVYVNSCPHTGAPLELKPGKFLSHDKQNIICSTHGALFEINTGLCIYGPCQDKHLEAIQISIDNGKILCISN